MKRFCLLRSGHMAGDACVAKESDLDGRVEIDDAYLRDERPGKRGPGRS